MLLIHADYIEYTAREAIKGVAEDIPEALRKGRQEETLAVFISCEIGDDKVEDLIEKATGEIKEVAEKLGVNRITVYPYAHLSSSLSSPSFARDTCGILADSLSEGGFEVLRSPFGWYKSFVLSCKGHPLSELSREIRFEGDGGGVEVAQVTGVEGEAKYKTREDILADVTSEYYIVTLKGEEIRLDTEDPTSLEGIGVLKEHPGLKTFILSEEMGGGKKGEPPSIKAMQRLELVDYEEVSDSGHFRLFPKGAMIFELLREWSGMAASRLGAMEIDTPILYDWNSPDIQSQVSSFHERHYTVTTPDDKRKFVLRFAGDFGLFRMMKGAILSYRTLPIMVYEFSKSFRMEQRGELSGLRRLRAFHMPDIHAFSVDLDQAWEQYRRIFECYIDFANNVGVDFQIGLRVVKEFWESSRDQLNELIVYANKPVLVEVISHRTHYWVVKHEIQSLDSVGGNCQLGTVQVDVEDAERYGITYTDKEGKEQGCIICHASIGSIERWMYTFLEDALKKEKPYLPFWLAPTQLRLIPISSEFVKDCEGIAEYLNCRTDIDDREESVGRRIRDAEKEWINLIVVYGKKEQEKGILPVRTRDGGVKDMGLKDLRREVDIGKRGFPYRPLPLPMLLSKRVSFRG